jgi:hypothetical protein
MGKINIPYVEKDGILYPLLKIQIRFLIQNA